MEDKTTKVRIAFFIILVGIATMFTAVVTDHWAVLSPRVERLNTTCQAAHFGLWRLCLKSIYIQEPDPKGKGCGPISLPGEQNCSYFKHFTSGEDAQMFQVKTQKGLCIIISVEVIRQSVKRMIDSDETIWIEYYYSWSFACACAAFVLLFLSGIALLLISMPQMPQNPWETCMDAEPETQD
ncbi:Voltage-dependent calcium channel gamma-1 subunit [Acipenser ruthenus]|uniref:Voltage-dependent calcium channel gamma-1 subunit n=1 Tax=Acipenser ruthenus TaxID=7906 RepID=A0A444UNP9_ACIRT|nr:Voltage-dependent calcium channel gamma-1 subunit [Acipenser ruthenus]